MTENGALTLGEVVTHLLEFFTADELAGLISLDVATVDAASIEQWAANDHSSFVGLWHRDPLRHLWDAKEVLLKRFGNRDAARVVFFNRRGSLSVQTLAGLARGRSFAEFVSRVDMTERGIGVYAKPLNEREHALLPA